MDLQIWLTDLWRDDNGVLFAADEDGKVHVRDNGGWQVESTTSARALTCLWGRSGRVFAAGDASLVFERQGSAWPAISPELGQTIFGLGGTGPDDLYACGDRGLLAHFDGREWTTIALPTNRRLTGVLAIGDADVLVCGTAGVLFRGSGETWRALDPAPSDLHSMVLFRDRIFLAASRSGVLELADDQYVPVRDTFVSYKLAANARYLASAGDISAVRSDLIDWDGIDYQ
ncbi:MAG: hypothetical protein U1E40_09645 [Amaricoccus sp.]